MLLNTKPSLQLQLYIFGQALKALSGAGKNHVKVRKEQKALGPDLFGDKRVMLIFNHQGARYCVTLPVY